MKKEIIELLNKIKREGILDLIRYLKESDFFSAPASVNLHGNVRGGLATHSLNVYGALVDLNSKYKVTDNEETLIICGLLHDLCKINFYVTDTDTATDAQLNYLSSLLANAKESLPPKEHMTKAYVSKLIDYYKRGGEKPLFREEWKVDDLFPLGHGEKSIYIIQKYIDLTDEEALAIRWHLGYLDAGTHFNFPSGYPYKQCVKDSPLVSMLTIADQTAAAFMDVWER